MTDEPINPALQSLLDDRLSPGAAALAVCCTDMLLSGRFDEAWLAVTPESVIAWQDGEVIEEVALADLRKVHVHEARGVSRLVVDTPSRAVLLAMCTGASRTKLNDAVAVLRSQLPDAGTESEDADTSAPASAGPGRKSSDICAKCGKPIPPHLGVCPDCLPRHKLLFRLLKRVKPFRWPFTFALLLLAVITAVSLTPPLIFGHLIDRVLPELDEPMFRLLIAVLLGTFLVSALLGGVRTYIIAWIGEHIVFDLRNEVYLHLQTLSLEYYDRKQTGWIMDRVASDTSNLQDFMADGLQGLLRDLMMVVGILIFMLCIHWQLTLVTILPVPLLLVLIYQFMRRLRHIFHRVWRRRSRISSLLSDVIPGVRVVKSFAQEAREEARFMERNRDYMVASLFASRVAAVFHPLFNFVGALGLVILWAFGGYWVIHGSDVTLWAFGGDWVIHGSDVTPGMLVTFMGFLLMFYGPLLNLSMLARRMQRAGTAAQRVFEVLDTVPTVIEPADRREMPPIEGRVEFRNVFFGYEPDQSVLKGFSFDVAPGEMIGLVGASGAGKSTTCNLLCRFYDVVEGAIVIDGVDIRDVTLRSLRRQIGVVQQDPFLFHGSVAENISYANPDSTPEEIIRAARAANAHDFILGFTEGYDTMVGERGQRLSGGERQRIAIARAILKDPAILVFDEATSSVDTESEFLIRDAISRLTKGRTTFAIAHRFSTLRDADRLIVIEDGKVAEMGSHSELLAKEDGVFKRLSKMQTELSEIVAVGG